VGFKGLLVNHSLTVQTITLTITYSVVCNKEHLQRPERRQDLGYVAFTPVPPALLEINPFVNERRAKRDRWNDAKGSPFLSDDRPNEPVKSVTKTGASSPYAINRVPNVNVRPYRAAQQSAYREYASELGKHHSTALLGAFVKLRTATVSNYQLRPVCPSVCLAAWNNSVSTGQICMRFVFDDFSKICQEISKLDT